MYIYLFEEKYISREIKNPSNFPDQKDEEEEIGEEGGEVNNLKWNIPLHGHRIVTNNGKI
jgi:hypothetical protein